MQEISNPSQKLLALIAKGLQEHANQNTIATLGDRKNYIGMSDIAMMSECPRLAVLRKLEPKHSEPVTMQNYEQILTRQLILQRGHWLEEGIDKALYANGFKIIPQLELSLLLGNTNAVSSKIHFDFIVVGENSIRILELKSTANIPKSAGKPYETQVKGQVSLLSKYAHLPLFSLRDAHGTLLYENLTFYEICRAYLGIEVKNITDIQAWLLCISMKEARAFGPYFPTNYVVNSCNEIAQSMWEYMENYKIDASSTIPHAKGFCISCSFCEYAKSCPKFEGEQFNEWEKPLDKLEFLKVLKDNTTSEITQIEDHIKQSIFHTQAKWKWLEAGSHRFRVAEQQGRKSLDKNKLIAELSLIMGEDEAIQLLAECELEGAPFARLYINKINK